VKSIVREKVELTAKIAAVGTLIAIVGGLLSLTPMFIIGLLTVAFSPFLSLYIMLNRLRRKA
jgi:hypothetical protein